MTKLELERRFKRAGWSIEHGANHDKAVSPDKAVKIPIPRHKGDLPKGLVFRIMKGVENEIRLSCYF